MSKSCFKLSIGPDLENFWPQVIEHNVTTVNWCLEFAMNFAIF